MTRSSARSAPVIADDALDTLDIEQLRSALRAARAELAFKQAFIDKLSHENAVLKRLKFAAQSEAYGPEQRSLPAGSTSCCLIAGSHRRIRADLRSCRQDGFTVCLR